MKVLTVKGVLSMKPEDIKGTVSALDVANRYMLAMGIASHTASNADGEEVHAAMKAVFDSLDEPGIVVSAWWAFEVHRKGQGFVGHVNNFQKALSKAMVTGAFGVPTGPTGVGVRPNLDERAARFMGPNGFDHAAASTHYMALVAAARADGSAVVEVDERALDPGRTA